MAILVAESGGNKGQLSHLVEAISLLLCYPLKKVFVKNTANTNVYQSDTDVYQLYMECKYSWLVSVLAVVVEW